MPNRELYKRNSILDALAKIIFSIGSSLHDKREENKGRKSSDYAAYIETEETLATSIDELENIADIVISAIGSTQSTRRKRLNPAEKTFYGVLHWLGLFVKKNNKIAQQYLEEAAVRNDTVAQTILIDIYSDLHEIERMAYWQKKVYSKYQTINKDAGKIEYKKGKAGEEDNNYQEAIDWYKKADALGNVETAFAIAEIYNYVDYYDFYGIDIDEIDDYEYDEFCRKWSEEAEPEAIKWYIKSAEKGNVEAMIKLGMLYNNAENKNESMYWFKKAASLGSSDAIYHIADDFEYTDEKKQIEWYRKAAEAGSIEAIKYLAEKYEHGNNIDEALKWYKKAADMGDDDCKNKITYFKLQKNISTLPCLSADKVQPQSVDVFRIVVIGEFSRGKSSFINAILGQRILPAKKGPCTSILTTVMYGDVLEYRIYCKGESVPRQISQDEFFAINSYNDFSFVEHAEIACPNVFCKDNVEIIDTPATNSLNGVESMEFINQADAVVMMFSTAQALTASEAQFIQKNFHSGIRKKLFFVMGFKDLLADVGDEKDVIDFFTRQLQSILPNCNLQNRIFLVNSIGALYFRRHERGEELKPRQMMRIPNNFNDTGFPAVEKALKNLIYNKHNNDTVDVKFTKYNDKSAWCRRGWK